LPPPLIPRTATTLGRLLILSLLAALRDALFEPDEQAVHHDQAEREAQVKASLRSRRHASSAAPNTCQDALSNHLGVVGFWRNAHASKHLHSLSRQLAPSAHDAARELRERPRIFSAGGRIPSLLSASIEPDKLIESARHSRRAASRGKRFTRPRG